MSEPVLLHEDTINKLAEVLAEKIRAPEKWIDAETLAAHFGVSLDTVYYWSSKTNIPRNKEGREFLLWYILSKKTLLFKDFVLTCTKTAPRKIQLRQISAS